LTEKEKKARKTRKKRAEFRKGMPSKKINKEDLNGGRGQAKESRGKAIQPFREVGSGSALAHWVKRGGQRNSYSANEERGSFCAPAINSRRRREAGRKKHTLTQSKSILKGKKEKKKESQHNKRRKERGGRAIFGILSF